MTLIWTKERRYKYQHNIGRLQYILQALKNSKVILRKLTLKIRKNEQIPRKIQLPKLTQEETESLKSLKLF